MAAIGRLLGRFTGNALQQAAGYGIGSAAGAALEPMVQPLANEAWAANPSRPLSPAELADLVVRGELTLDQAAGEAEQSGINRFRFEQLVKSTGNPPGLGELLELLRRHNIDTDDVERGIRQSRTRSEWIPALLELARVLLSPAELAQMVVQGVVPEGEAAGLAARSGVDSADFTRMVAVAGSPPGPGELLDLWNRGEIGEADVDKGLRQSRIKPEWTEAVKALRDHVPPVGDVIRFAVREVFDPATVARFGLEQDFPTAAVEPARRAGLPEEELRRYWAAHWDLPSPTQGFGMLHRGLIDHDTLKALLKALDVAPFWRDRLIQLAYLVPGRVDLRRMYREGVIDRARVLRGYRDIGYSPEDAETLTRFAVEEKMNAEKDLAKTEVLSLLEAREITETVAQELLGQLGYSTEEAGLLIGLAHYRADRAYRNAVIAVVRARYVDREIDTTVASEQLDRIGTPPEQRERLLDLWTFQRDENPRRLTEAQARAAWKRALIDEAGYRAYLAQLGYPELERDLLVGLYG